MSLFNFKRFIACFVDENGDYVGKKIFKRSMGTLGQDKYTFNYLGGSYNINPLKATRLELIFSGSILWDNYVYVYRINNPDPISFRGGAFLPVMDAHIYKERLENKLVVDLNRIASGGFQINWKWVIIALVVFGVAYYFLNGGTIIPPSEVTQEPVDTARGLIPLLLLNRVKRQ